MAANSTQNEATTSSVEEKLSTYDFVIGILALFSLVILVLLIFVPLSATTEAFLNVVENFLCIIFLFDFFRSLVRAEKKSRYFFRGGGWLDLLGSIPFGGLAIFRFARLFRIARVMRTLKANDFRKLLTQQIAQNTLLFTLVIAFLLIFSISGIVLYLEKGAPGANILTYPDAVWWAVVTITTVGYGDYYPVTGLGRSMAVILMFFGLGIIGVLSSYLSSTFISMQEKDENTTKQDTGDENHNEQGDAANRDAELAAIREELASLKKLVEEHYNGSSRSTLS